MPHALMTSPPDLFVRVCVCVLKHVNKYLRIINLIMK